MSNVIDFQKARAKRKSGITDMSVINDMIDNAYDPCDPTDRQAYWDRCNLIESLQNFSIGPVTITQDDPTFTDLSSLFDFDK